MMPLFDSCSNTTSYYRLLFVAIIMVSFCCHSALSFTSSLSSWGVQIPSSCSIKIHPLNLEDEASRSLSLSSSRLRSDGGVDVFDSLFGSIEARAKFFSEDFGRNVVHYRRKISTDLQSPLGKINIQDLYDTSDSIPLRKRGSVNYFNKNRMNFVDFSNYIIDGGSAVISVTNDENILMPLKVSVEESLDRKVTMNVYHSGTRAVALNRHYDRYDVFVLQVDGEKEWEICRDGLTWTNTTMIPGDVLYIPQGIYHAATTAVGFDSTTHVTIGLMNDSIGDHVKEALAKNVSREQIGNEIDLMFKSHDPASAMRLLVDLNLANTVFPLHGCLSFGENDKKLYNNDASLDYIFRHCLDLLSATHDHLLDCKMDLPIWCEPKRTAKSATFGVKEQVLLGDEETKRLLSYASFLKPFVDLSKRIYSEKHPDKKLNNISAINRLLVDELKRPVADAEAVECIIGAADEITRLIDSGCDLSALDVLMNDIAVRYTTSDNDQESSDGVGSIKCSLGSQLINSETETNPLWSHAMEFRLLCSGVLKRVGLMWRAAVILSLSEQLVSLGGGTDCPCDVEGYVTEKEYMDEVRKGTIERYNVFAASLQQLGLIGIWRQKPLLDGEAMGEILQHVPRGAAFDDIMDEQDNWMITHPCGTSGALTGHMKVTFADYL